MQARPLSGAYPSICPPPRDGKKLLLRHDTPLPSERGGAGGGISHENSQRPVYRITHGLRGIGKQAGKAPRFRPFDGGYFVGAPGGKIMAEGNAFLILTITPCHISGIVKNEVMPAFGDLHRREGITKIRGPVYPIAVKTHCCKRRFYLYCAFIFLLRCVAISQLSQRQPHPQDARTKKYTTIAKMRSDAFFIMPIPCAILEILLQT